MRALNWTWSLQVRNHARQYHESALTFIGSSNTPAPGALAQNLVLLRLMTSDGQPRTYKCLNMQFLTATLLSQCKTRGLLWDPRKDILYLCKNQSAEVQRIRTQLNSTEVKEMFLGTSLFSRLPVDDQRLCYQLLLNTEPPPTMAITPPAPAEPTSNPVLTTSTQQGEDARVPRSRYRNASGQRSSSSGKVDIWAANNVRPQSQDRLQDPRQVTHIVSVQCVNAGKSQPVSASSAARRARKSMPNLMAVPDKAPLHTRPGDANISKTRQQQESLNRYQNVSKPPASVSPDSKLTRSRLEYGTEFQPVYLDGRKDAGYSNRSAPPDQSTLASRSDSTRTDSTNTTVPGIQSQKGSLHVVSPEGEEVPRQQYFEDAGAQPRGRLHLVGPEGLYVSPETAQDVAQAQHQRHKSAPPPQTESRFVFELDATAPSRPTFIAELPADSVVLPLTDQHETRFQELSSGEVNARSSNPRTTSAPSAAGSLPASLVAGGPGTHHQALGHPKSSGESTSSFSIRQTNEYRYSFFKFPQTVDLEASHPPSESVTTSMYQAYRPFAASDELNSSERLRPAISSGHKRSASKDSTASHDSAKLAKEYQDLLDFEEGYGSH